MIGQNYNQERRQTVFSRSSRSSTLKQEQEKSFLQSFGKQMLKAWLPIPSLTRTIVLFFIISLIFLGIGIPMIILSNNIVSSRVDYDSVCSTTTCTVPFEIRQNMVGPVFVFYQLQNYYQNHRLYAKSISFKQIQGQSISISDADSSCTPITLNSQLYKSVSITGAPLDQSAPANPCGMIAYSYFNDSYQIAYPNGTNISTMTTDQINWASDTNRLSMPNPQTMWLNITDPRVINWMRLSTLSSFRKLWARINHDLQAGNYTLTVQRNYPIESYGAKRYFVISTSNSFGSSNIFLSVIYLVIGSLCFCIAVGFLIKKCRRKSMRNY